MACGFSHAPLISPGIGPIYGASGLICGPRAYVCTLLCTLLQAAGGAAGECFPILWEPPSWPEALAFGLQILGAHSQDDGAVLRVEASSSPVRYKRACCELSALYLVISRALLLAL